MEKRVSCQRSDKDYALGTWRVSVPEKSGSLVISPPLRKSKSESSKVHSLQLIAIDAVDKTWSARRSLAGTVPELSGAYRI